MLQGVGEGVQAEGMRAGTVGVRVGGGGGQRKVTRKFSAYRSADCYFNRYIECCHHILNECP